MRRPKRSLLPPFWWTTRYGVQDQSAKSVGRSRHKAPPQQRTVLALWPRVERPSGPLRTFGAGSRRMAGGRMGSCAVALLGLALVVPYQFERSWLSLLGE